MKPWILPSLLVAAVLAVALGVYALASGPRGAEENAHETDSQGESPGRVDMPEESSPEPSAGQATSVPGLGTYVAASAEGGQKEYRSTELGVSFAYPAKYLLFEKEGTDSGGAEYRMLTLQEDSAMVRDALAGTVAAGTEWPPAIRLGFYHEPSGAPETVSALKEWVRAHPQESIYFPQMPSGAPFTPVMAGGIGGISYDSPGLYWTHVAAFSYGEWVLIASVDSFDPKGDPRAGDFAALLAAISISNGNDL